MFNYKLKIMRNVIMICIIVCLFGYVSGYERLVAINETKIYDSHFVELNVKTGEYIKYGDNMNVFIQQGTGSVCEKYNRFYVFGQASFSDGTQIDSIIGIDVNTTKIIDKINVPFVAMNVMGYGHTLTVDKVTCDVYTIGLRGTSIDNLHHALYKYNQNNGLHLILDFGDIGNYGSSMVPATAYDPKRNRLWMTQGFLSEDGNVRLYAYDLNTGKRVVDMIDWNNYSTLDYDSVTGDIYSVGVSMDPVMGFFLYRIDSNTGLAKQLLQLDVNDIRPAISSLNSQTRKLYVLVEKDFPHANSAVVIATISLDTNTVINYSNPYHYVAPNVIASFNN